MKFPKPWVLWEVGPTELIVLDAKGRKLFYIVGDEGQPSDDEEYDVPPSELYYGKDSDLLLDEIDKMLGRKS